MTRTITIAWLCLLLSTPIQASKLPIIYDSGDTLPIAPYLPNPEKQPPQQSQPRRLPFKLPITTPSMQPGEVSATPQALIHLHQPVFLVGSDSMSKAWLKNNHDRLLQISAVGLLVEAKTLNDIDTMLSIANGLRIAPASAEAIAKELGLTHYPILLSKEGWEQ